MVFVMDLEISYLTHLTLVSSHQSMIQMIQFGSPLMALCSGKKPGSYPPLRMIFVHRLLVINEKQIFPQNTPQSDYFFDYFDAFLL